MHDRGRAGRGFTLIETLVAIAVFTLAIVAPFEAASRSLHAADSARDNLAGAQLAQEGLEYMREVRDNNYLANPTGYTPFYGVEGSPGPDCRSPHACAVDPTSPFGSASAVKLCSTATCSAVPLYLSSTGLYNQQNNGTATRFSRAVSVVQNPNGEAGVERVTVTVTWPSGASTAATSLTEDFYDWL